MLLAFLFEHRLATRDGLAIAMVAWSSTLVVNVAITAIAQRSARPRDRYGGEDDEVIRFMESTTTSEEAPSETWPAEVESWLVEVQEEAHLIEALPYVKGTVSFFYSEESTNLNKFHVTVWCCWSAGRLKRVPVHCNEVQRFTHSCCLMSSLRWAPGSQKNA